MNKAVETPRSPDTWFDYPDWEDYIRHHLCLDTQCSCGRLFPTKNVASTVNIVIEAFKHCLNKNKPKQNVRPFVLWDGCIDEGFASSAGIYSSCKIGKNFLSKKYRIVIDENSMMFIEVASIDSMKNVAWNIKEMDDNQIRAILTQCIYDKLVPEKIDSNTQPTPAG